MSNAKDEVVQKLQEKLGGAPTCPVCKKNQVSANDKLCLLTTIDTEKKIISLDAGVAVAALICTHCGHVMLFSAVALGVDPTR